LLLSAGFPADWVRAAFPLAPREVLREQIRKDLTPFMLEGQPFQGCVPILDRLLAGEALWSVLPHQWKLAPVLVVRNLLMWAVVYHQQVGGSPKAFTALRTSEKRRRADCDKDIEWLSRLATRRPKDDVLALAQELIKCIQRDRDLVPIAPGLIKVEGEAARDHQGQATAAVFRHLGTLLPRKHPDRKSVVTTLARALGVQFKRFAYHDYVKRYD